MLFRRNDEEDRTVVHMLASAIRRDIAFGALMPDSKLKIAELRSRYGGSNHSMRESLRLLTAEGLVAAEAQRGFRVTSATEGDLADILLVRYEIESIALRMSLDRGDVSWEGRVVAAHHALKRAEAALHVTEDDVSALEWDESCRAFATALIDACDSPRLIDMQRKLFDQSRRFRLAMFRENTLNFSRREGDQIQLVEAALARNFGAASDTLSRYIESEMRVTARTV